MTEAIYGFFLVAIAFVAIMAVVIGIGLSVGYLFGPDR